MTISKSSRRFLSALLTLALVFSLFSAVFETHAKAAEGAGGILIKPNGQAVSESELYSMINDAYWKVSHFSFSLTGTANPYAPTGWEQNGEGGWNTQFCCASFVTYVYCNYIGRQMGFSENPANIGAIPLYTDNQPIHDFGVDTSKGLWNGAAVAAWYDFICANPSIWGTIVETQGGKEIDEGAMRAGALLFFSPNGIMNFGSDGASHIAIYGGKDENGVGWMYHCGSDNGVEKVEFNGYINKMGGKALACWINVVDETIEIQVNKTDEKGAPMEKIVFYVYENSVAAENEIAWITTDSNGYAAAKNLNPGDYVVKEYGYRDAQGVTHEGPPPGYTYSPGTTGEYSFYLNEENSPYEIEAVNVPIGEARITKIWRDKDNEQGLRPLTITVDLYKTKDGATEIVENITMGIKADGSPIEGTTVSADSNSWYYIIKNADPDAEYSIEELDIAVYDEDNNPVYSSLVDNALLLITNTLTDIPDQPTTSIEVIYPVDTPPKFDFPEFSIDLDKLDKEFGFDGPTSNGSSTSTPRGDGTLAATYKVTWSADGADTAVDYVTSDHWGSTVTSTYRPWTSVNQLTEVGYNTKYLCEVGDYATYVEYYGSGTCTVEEIPPEGYLDEVLSETGSGVRSFTFSYNMSAERDAYCEVTEEFDEEENHTTIIHEGILEEWEYEYTYNGSSGDAGAPSGGIFSTTGPSTRPSSAHHSAGIGSATFVNRVRKNNYELVKSYAEDLDPWSPEYGQKEPVDGSKWTLHLISGGSEQNPYVRVKQINKGETGDDKYATYDDYANCYYVTRDESGVPADENNPLLTSKYGRLRIYALPYGDYILQEIESEATDGYVLETVYIHIGDDYEKEDEDPLSNNVDNEVKKNTIKVVKKDIDTGKTVPYAGAAFRVRYMGNPNTANGGGNVEDDPNYGRYIINGPNIGEDYGGGVGDGSQYLFYTDTTGRITLPYELEYGIYQLEEVIAPEGYYIGRYDADGEGHIADGDWDYSQTVVIYDKDGSKVTFPDIEESLIYNYYSFTVDEQSYVDEDGDGYGDEGAVREIVVQIVEMTNNAVHGKIEITKYGDTLVGFSTIDSDYGEVNIPIYEMRPLKGAKFEIIAAVDEFKSDGYSAPPLLDGDGNYVTPTLVEFNHLLWPDAVRTEYAKMPDGTEAFIVTTAQSDSTPNPDNGTATGNTPNIGEQSKTNTITATLLTALQKGTEYSLVYEVRTEAEDSDNGVGFTTTYDILIGLEYAAGGWNYSYVDITMTTTYDDYIANMPEHEFIQLHYGGKDIANETATMDDGSEVEIHDLTNETNTEVDVFGNYSHDVSLEAVENKYYYAYKPTYEIIKTPAHNYLGNISGDEVTITIPDDYTVVSVSGYYCFEDSSGAYYFVTIDDNEEQQFTPHEDNELEYDEEIIYTNKPDVPEEYSDWMLEVLEFDWNDEVSGDTRTELHYALTQNGHSLFCVTDPLAAGKPITWIPGENLSFNGTMWQYNVVAPPDGYVLEASEPEYGYLAYKESDGGPRDYVLYVRVIETGELRWVPINGSLETFITREQSVSFTFGEAPGTDKGFAFEVGGFQFHNIADSKKESATATIINPSDEEPVITDPVGLEVVVSEDGRTHTFTVVQPTEGAYYELADGTRVAITYLGMYTKTLISVPHKSEMPTITYKDAKLDYYNLINMDNLDQTVNMGNGNYVTTHYNYLKGVYNIEIVSNQTDDVGFKVKYYDERESISKVIYDPDAEAYRGELDIVFVTKTLVYTASKVIETVVTDENGIAYSSLLPLGTYYVREIYAPLGFVNSNETFEVNLEYGGQYIPLIWGSVTGENEGLKVTIDIAKCFQDAVGSDNYEYKAGAVYGVFNKNAIYASDYDSENGLRESIEAESLLSVITIGEDGYATSTIKLPYMNDYYIMELDTLDGYTLSDIKYLFRVDEQILSTSLTFKSDYNGISGEINQSNLFETTITIDTLYQVPAVWMKVNDEEFTSDEGFEEIIAGDALLTNEVFLDKTTTTIVSTETDETVIWLANGGTITVNVYSDGYSAVFTDPTHIPEPGEPACTLDVDKGAAGVSTIKEEILEDGSRKYTYEPTVAYTGYSVDISDSYREPTTVMTTMDDVRLNLFFSKTSGHRTAILLYPKEYPMPDDSAPWIIVDEENSRVVVDMQEIVASNASPYEHEIVTRYINGKMDAQHFSHIANSNTALTAKDIIRLARLTAQYDNSKVAEDSIIIDSIQLDAINAEIARIHDSGLTSELKIMPLEVSTTDKLNNMLKISLNVELRGAADVVSALPNPAAVSDHKAFPVYGESIFFDVNNSSFDISTAGKACTYGPGMRNDNIEVSYTTSPAPITSVTHRNKVFKISAENATSAVMASLNHDSTYAKIEITQGNAIKVFSGSEALIPGATFYPLNPGDTLTILTDDEALYTATLDTNGVFKHHGECVINGTLAAPPDAPSAALLGTTVFTNTTLVTDAKAEFAENLTHTRSSSSVSSIQVKINSKSDNHGTENQENGDSDGDTDGIHNDIIYVEFEKVDVDGSPLAGAVIAVYDSDGKEVFRGTSDANGIVLWQHVKPGTYTFREIKAPEGYELDNTVYTITVYADGTTSGGRTIVNKEIEAPAPTPTPPNPTPTPKPKKVELTKTDITNGEPVPGATIVIWDKQTGRQLYSGKTDDNGKIILDMLPEGTYVYQEIVSPDGYILNSEQYEFHVDKNGKITGTVEFTNEPKPDTSKIVIDKTDLTDGSPVPGATIHIWDKQTGRVVFYGVTDKNGQIVIDSLPAGAYIFKEIVAPNGFILNEEEFEFTVDGLGNVTGTTGITNKRKPGEEEDKDLIITKTDLTDGKPVPGATITIWDKETGREIFTGVTDDNGNITISKPPAGTYIFREEVAPDGYILNTEEFEFHIDAHGKITGTTNITNEPLPEGGIDIVIDKTDATDASEVPGAEITIWDEDGNEVFRGITDENGKLKFKVPKPGKYTFKETYAPEGYDIVETVFEFVVHENGAITGKTGIKNIRTGTVVISKIDIVDGAEVPGAEITIADEYGDIVFKQISDEHGKIYFFPPAPGTYTFYESYSPDGYYLNEEKFQFTVDREGNITSGVTYLENVPVGTVVIRKKDVSDGKELPGAEITIWDNEGFIVFKDFTDERGRVYFVTDDWGPGTYYFRETIAPNGYLINEETFSFHIDEDGVITGATDIMDEKDPNYKEKENILVPKTGLTNWTSILLAALGAVLCMGILFSTMYKKSKLRQPRDGVGALPEPIEPDNAAAQDALEVPPADDENVSDD